MNSLESVHAFLASVHQAGYLSNERWEACQAAPPTSFAEVSEHPALATLWNDYQRHALRANQPQEVFAHGLLITNLRHSTEHSIEYDATQASHAEPFTLVKLLPSAFSDTVRRVVFFEKLNELKNNQAPQVSGVHSVAATDDGGAIVVFTGESNIISTAEREALLLSLLMARENGTLPSMNTLADAVEQALLEQPCVEPAVQSELSESALVDLVNQELKSLPESEQASPTERLHALEVNLIETNFDPDTSGPPEDEPEMSPDAPPTDFSASEYVPPPLERSDPLQTDLATALSQDSMSSEPGPSFAPKVSSEEEIRKNRQKIYLWIGAGVALQLLAILLWVVYITEPFSSKSNNQTVNKKYR